MDLTLRRLRIHSRTGTLPYSPLLSSSTTLIGWLGGILIGISLLLSSCGGVILVGAGVGAGAFSYIAGNVIRVYQVEYQHGIEAGITVMKQYNFKQKEESEYGLKTVIEGTLNDDTPITIEVAFVDQASTQIGVRTGYIGNDNLEISEQLHSYIAEELTGLGPPNLTATSRKRKISEPRTVESTSQAMSVQPEDNELRVTRSLYDDLPPPPKRSSSKTADGQNVLSIDSGQEIKTPPQTENEQEISELFQTEAAEIKNHTESPAAERSTVPVGSVSTSTINEPESTFSIDFGQETQTPPETENEQEVSELFQTEATEIKKYTESPAAERSTVPADSVTTTTAGEPENTFSIDSGQETQASPPSVREGGITEQLQARVTEIEDEVKTPVSEPMPALQDDDIQARVTEIEDEAKTPVSEPMPALQDDDMEETEEKAAGQELQALLIPESKDIVFTYYPESERTIHTGSYRVLDQVIAYLGENPSTRVDIRAYLDSSSTEDRDLALTQKRVFEIRNYLVLKGISEERILAQGLGENDFPETVSLDQLGSQKHPVEMIIR